MTYPIVLGDQASVNMQEMALMQAGWGKIDFCIYFNFLIKLPVRVVFVLRNI